MDFTSPSSIATWAAALFAAVVATAHTLHQYFVTDRLMRLCDGIVFGFLPGRGRRIWLASRFRFRVVYKMPQIGLPPELWPSSAFPSFTRKDGSLQDILEGRNKSGAQSVPLRTLNMPKAMLPVGRPLGLWNSPKMPGNLVGEASWALFCWTVYPTCRASMRFSSVDNDADRCPADLPTVPMRTSLRDAVAMALMSGMECTYASFSGCAVSMQGAAGTLTSAEHPVLGATIHFSPNNTGVRHGIGYSGTVSKDWLWRAMDNCIVAGRHYNKHGRRAIEAEVGSGFWKSGATGFVYPSSEGQPGETTDNPSNRPLEFGSDRPGTAPLSNGEYLRPPTSLDGPWSLITGVPSGIGNRIYPPISHWESDTPDFTAFATGRDPKGRGAHRGGSRHVPPPRPVYTRMSFQHVEPETLDLYKLPWQIDKDPTFALIRQWVPEDLQDALWSHTRRLRKERRKHNVKHKMGDALNQQYAAIDPGRRVTKGLRRRKRGASVRMPPRKQAKESHEWSSTGSDASDIDSAKAKRVVEASAEDQQPQHPESHGQEPQASPRAQPRESGEHDPGSQPQSSSSIPSENGPREDQDEAAANPDTTNEAPTSRKRQLRFSLPPGHVEDEPSGSPIPSYEQERLDRGKERLSRARDLEHINAQNGIINWFWLSQTDIIPGFWATPWRSFEKLNGQLCYGAETVLLQAIVNSLGDHSVNFLEFPTSSSQSPFDSAASDPNNIRGTVEWMRAGNTTFPTYAYDAQGGVVCEGNFTTVSSPFYPVPIPAFELVGMPSPTTPDEQPHLDLERRLVELMRMDAWLSIVGGLRVIRDGPNKLLWQAPSLVQALMLEFEQDFLDPYLSRDVADDVFDWLRDWGLAEAEALYAVVASLRTVKVAQCVLLGSDTTMLAEIFERDVQVSMV